MEKQSLMDKLSEFLMVEQGGLELYRVAASRCSRPDLRHRYVQFEQQTAYHREVLVRLIERLGGDPSYISPTARLAQFKVSKLLESALVVDGLSQREIEANDLENLLLAETKDHADWHFLEALAGRLPDGDMKRAIGEAAAAVEEEEDEHLRWASTTLAELGMESVLNGPAPLPQRWQEVISAPEPPVTEIHPATMGKDGLLPPAREAPWQDAPAVKAVRGR